MPLTLPWLDPEDPQAPFPDLHRALREPDGLLAFGGDLSPARLVRAYRNGIFPWYSA
ncbi:MAG TPA: leucyl/phenylalanyl-tRNA--protein transferase, partial [Chromatiales bacterium]|nr:leucyl/phenylalanyl-tRNA--protein transferase [Chromatiales bacterium]